MVLPPIEPLEPRRFLAADLTATVTGDPTFITTPTGGLVRPTITLRNDGDFPVQSIWTMRFVLTPDAEIGNGNDFNVGTETRSFLQAGSTLVTSPGIVLPFAPPSGSYFLGVVLDTTNTVAESDEDNNTVFTALPLVTVFTGSGVLPINGTSEDDVIRVLEQGAILSIAINDRQTSLIATGVTGLEINTGGGNDFVELVTDFDATMDLSDGNDSVSSGRGNDVIAGRAGRDRIFGGAGNDHVIGGPGGDFLFGDNGDDTVSGNGGHDRIVGGFGEDYLVGGAGNDFFFSSGDGDIDTVSGNAGDDLADADPDDVLVSVTAV